MNYRADKVLIDTQTDSHTQADAGNDNIRRPKLASGRNRRVLFRSLLKRKLCWYLGPLLMTGSRLGTMRIYLEIYKFHEDVLLVNKAYTTYCNIFSNHRMLQHYLKTCGLFKFRWGKYNSKSNKCLNSGVANINKSQIHIMAYKGTGCCSL